MQHILTHGILPPVFVDYMPLSTIMSSRRGWAIKKKKANQDGYKLVDEPFEDNGYSIGDNKGMEMGRSPMML